MLGKADRCVKGPEAQAALGVNTGYGLVSLPATLSDTCEYLG